MSKQNCRQKRLTLSLFENLYFFILQSLVLFSSMLSFCKWISKECFLFISDLVWKWSEMRNLLRHTMRWARTYFEWPFPLGQQLLCYDCPISWVKRKRCRSYRNYPFSLVCLSTAWPVKQSFHSLALFNCFGSNVRSWWMEMVILPSFICIHVLRYWFLSPSNCSVWLKNTTVFELS